MQTSKLDQRDRESATAIWQLFRQAYTVEAQILGLKNFPPLNRTIRHIQEASTTFYGGWQASTLVAVAELENRDTGRFHINSLGVSPAHFRQGFAFELLNNLFAYLTWQQITVATAVVNIPALKLYQKLGFQAQETWKTPDNIPMITLLLEK